MQENKFYICRHCGNIIGLVNDAGVPMMCCGAKMDLLEANTVDASQEKHLPVVTVEGNTVKVSVGSIAHPMTDDHYIQWVYVQTAAGGQRKAFKPGDAPEAVFALVDDTAVAVYAYCNLHGLWKTEI